jgi:hypothetical protein
MPGNPQIALTPEIIILYSVRFFSHSGLVGSKQRVSPIYLEEENSLADQNDPDPPWIISQESSDLCAEQAGKDFPLQMSTCQDFR